MNETTSEHCINPTEDDERDHLRHVIDRVSAELSAHGTAVDARQAETRTMVTDLHEQRDEMDHAEKANMRESVNVMRTISEHGVAQQKRLAKLIDRPYFGRIDISDSTGRQSEPVYIGIHSFYDSDAEQQLVHDWRAPVSSVFYEFELGDAWYHAPAGRINCRVARKRQYRIENRKLLFMLETSLTIQDDILQKELSQASSEQMRNIVATIQRDQNAIIRDDASHSLIIQGAAGSGKTSIALHRIAFLLYRYKDSIRSEDILIISPNKVFAHYISQVLPELGEEMVQETTMETLAGMLLGHQAKFQTFSEQVTHLLNRGEKKYAERVRFKATADFLNKLDDYIYHLRTTNFTPTELAIGAYTFAPGWVANQYARCRELPLSDQLKQMVENIIDHMKTEYLKDINGKERSQLRSDLKKMFAQTTLKAIYKNFYTWLGRPEMFKALKGGRYEYSDVFPLIYLKMFVDGPFPVRPVKHVVIDEMQDYTPVQYQVLSRLYRCKKTILGDHNQAVSPLSSSSAEAIQDVLHQAQCMYMHKSYRSTLQITELAQSIHRNPNLEPIERHGQMPAIVTCDDPAQEISHIRQVVDAFLDSDFNTLGMICKTQEQADRLYEAIGDGRRDIHLLDADSTAFSRGVLIATAYLAKGLEFDEVLVPFCDEAEYHADIDRHMLYVACTRAMHRLTLTHTGNVSPLLKPALDCSLAQSHAPA